MSTCNLLSTVSWLKKRAGDDVVSPLESAELKLRRIQLSLDAMGDLPSPEVIQSTFVDTATEGIAAVQIDLGVLQSTFKDKSNSTEVPSSQNMIEDLNRINHTLDLLDDSLNQIMVIGELFKSKVTELEGRIDEMATTMNSAFGVPVASVAVKLLRADLKRVISESEECLLGYRSPVLDFIALDSDVPEFYFSAGKSKLEKKQFFQAARYFNAAYESGRWEASYYLGKLYYNGQGVAVSHDKAFQFYKVGERYKYIPSIYEVGWCTSVGHGTKLSIIGAQGYLEKAAEAGNVSGMREYGFHLLHGTNVKQNWPRAVRLLNRAHEGGDREAELILATCYEHGLVVDRNLKKVFDITMKAYEAGALWSDANLARCYEEGIGTVRDFVKAADIYRRIYERGGWEGKVDQAHYGMCLIRGRGVKQDIHRGLHIMKSGLDDSCSIGWRLYGDCFRYGYGVTKNLQKAVEYYTKACSGSIGEGSRAKAHFRLAQMYESGKCLPLHPGKAVHHYKYAADHLFAPAQMKMGQLLEAGIGIEAQKYRAFHYFHLAARNGNVEGQKKASEYLMKGMGVQRDRSNAIRFLKDAVQAGDAEAKEMLWKARIRVIPPFPRSCFT